MIRLLLIAIIVIYLMRFIIRLLYPKLPAQAPQKQALEMKACEYCGILSLETACVERKGHIFCGQDHAHRFFL